MNNTKIVKVTWIDAQRIELGVLQDYELADLDVLPCDIVGFLLHEDEEKIILSQEKWHDNRGQKYIHVIPKISIKKITELRE